MKKIKKISALLLILGLTACLGSATTGGDQLPDKEKNTVEIPEEYINKDLETGFVIPPNSPIDLKRAMSELVENSKLAKKMGKAALERYKKLFTLKIMETKTTNLYKSLL